MTAAPAALGTVAPGFELVREAYTHGWLADAVIRRVNGRRAGDFVRDELAHGLDLRLGLAPGDELADERAGAGGSSHGCWPSRRASWSYVTAELRSEDEDTRARSLLAALHEAVSR